MLNPGRRHPDNSTAEVAHIRMMAAPRADCGSAAARGPSVCVRKIQIGYKYFYIYI